MCVLSAPDDTLCPDAGRSFRCPVPVAWSAVVAALRLRSDTHWHISTALGLPRDLAARVCAHRRVVRRDKLVLTPVQRDRQGALLAFSIENGLAPATSAPGLGPPRPHLHRDRARRSHHYASVPKERSVLRSLSPLRVLYARCPANRSATHVPTLGPLRVVLATLP